VASLRQRAGEFAGMAHLLTLSPWRDALLSAAKTQRIFEAASPQIHSRTGAGVLDPKLGIRAGDAVRGPPAALGITNRF
jgi:hypothetical protein